MFPNVRYVVVPENFKSIERLAFAYDAGKESMHAIKQFVYSFPDLADLPAHFVHIKEEVTDEIPERGLLGEYTFSHFEAQYTSKLHFDPKRYLTSWLENKKNVFLVSGSFSRSAVSNTFKKSFAEQCDRGTYLPLVHRAFFICIYNTYLTEYGIANLYGKNLKERATALINIAHPMYRRNSEAAFELNLRSVLHRWVKPASHYLI